MNVQAIEVAYFRSESSSESEGMSFSLQDVKREDVNYFRGQTRYILHGGKPQVHR